jgi:MFS family permease
MKIHYLKHCLEDGKYNDMIKKLALNRILYVLIFSDLVVISAYGLLAPIFGIFLLEKIAGGTLVVIGISEAIYLISKSLIQIPVSIMIDKTPGQKIDFWLLFLGNLLMAFSLFAYIWVSLPIHIYLISFVYGLGGALAYPAWTGLFTRNIVENKESFAWSFSTTLVELGRAGAAIVGAIIGQMLGFTWLFIIVGGLSLFGTFLLFMFYRELTQE